MDTERFGHDRWKNAEEEAVAKTRKTGDETEQMWVEDVESAQLSDEEDHAS